MGAKYSVGRKELDETSGHEVTPGPSRKHDDVDGSNLVGNHGNYKAIDHSSKDINAKQVNKPSATYDSSTHKNQAKDTHEVTDPKKLVQKSSSGSSTSTHRCHPYDEVTDELVILNRKGSKENSDAILNKKKAGKKSKDAKSEPDKMVHPDLQEAPRKSKSSTESVDLAAGHSTSENNETILASNKKADKKKKEKFKQTPKEKVDKKKQKDEAVVQNTAPEQTVPQPRSKQIRQHSYDEILVEQLDTNREAKKAKDKKSKDNPKEKKVKQKSEVTTDLRVIPVEAGAKAKLNSGTGSTPHRYHPYEEVPDELLAANTAAMKETKGGKLNQRHQGEVNNAQRVEDDEESEYLNVAVISKGATPKGNITSTQSEDGNINNITDLYAVPQKQKKPVKVSQPEELNYIEVEFNTSTNKPKLKETYSPTDYSNIVTKDGRLKEPYTPTNYSNIITKDGKIVIMDS